MRAKLKLGQEFGISIHALLAESDAHAVRHVAADFGISIHALLAESDRSRKRYRPRGTRYFYPRSPCGERPSTL